MINSVQFFFIFASWIDLFGLLFAMMYIMGSSHGGGGGGVG